jgi:transcriptional regulator with XRE-family HTH domain
LGNSIRPSGISAEFFILKGIVMVNNSDVLMHSFYNILDQPIFALEKKQRRIEHMLSEKLREVRMEAGLTQEQAAEKLGVTRSAIARWETNKGIPDISNLIAISNYFHISLDEMIKGNEEVKEKIIADSSSKKWHLLVIVYLLAIVIYIAYFAMAYKILMIGFLISTLFMLFFEVRIFIKEKIYAQRKKESQP